MGGLGKTALVKKILGDVSHFKRRALATVSQTLKEDEFFIDIIQQLFPGEAWEMQQLLVHRRKERLRERLEDENYLIVVDDVWERKHWDQIKVTFPGNNHGSRVIVTTHKELVARHSTRDLKEKRFVDVISKADQGTRARRLSIHHYDDKMTSNAWPQFRSLLVFQGMESDGFKTSKLLGDRFKMLGVLDLTKAPLDTFPEEISTMYLLRHLSLRRTRILVVPKFIRNLQRLETLDFKYTLVTELPDEISLLQKLCHLLISNIKETKDWFYKSRAVKVTSNIGCLVSLQHLCFIEVPEDKDWLKGLGRAFGVDGTSLYTSHRFDEVFWKHVIYNYNSISILEQIKVPEAVEFVLKEEKNVQV
ncbi:hypothetical protein RJT34_11102 [Clitoria ternatea]|uniref:NB-ARC domain-containing protein n=1 Tax=Clitoria ternatea TaxID=43366 RepID=A0AAN9PJ69_CLITE